MFSLGTIDSDSDGEMLSVLLDKSLYFLCSVIDAICGEREAIGVEPMMVSAEHLHLEIVAYLVDKGSISRRGFSAYKSPISRSPPSSRPHGQTHSQWLA